MKGISCPVGTLEYNLIQQNKMDILSYLFSGYIVAPFLRHHTSDFYQTLCDIYTDKSASERFNFNGVLIPKPPCCYQRMVVAEVLDFFIYYLIDNCAICDAFTHEGPYELGEVKIGFGDVVVDCGANMGLFSALASHKGASGVYAFEPSQSVIDTWLSKTAKWNSNIHVCNYALSDKDERLQFVEVIASPGGGHLASINPQMNKDPRIFYEVSAISLDSFVHERNLSRVDFIKADIEGAERYMLKGARLVLKEFAPKLAICTYHNLDDPQILREMIMEANPNYIIEEKFAKMYAYVR